jgi:hypothetical protein
MEFPFDVYCVPGSQALDKLAELQAANKGYPVILGNANSFSRVEETFEMNEEQSVEELISAAQEIIPQDWFLARQESDPDYYEIKEGEWPEEACPGNRLSAHCNVSTGEPYSEVYIAVVPAPESWMIPCYMRIGGWNECPSAEEHAAIFKYWGEKYKATVACIADDIIEFQVAQPPTTQEEALHLAKEQYIYCADIVDQGTGTIEALAATLLNGKVWYFWWD